MMYGFRDEFKYFICPECGCLQLKGFPADLGKYYPPNHYYSFEPPDLRNENAVKQYLRKKRAKYCLSRTDLIGKLLASSRSVPRFYKWLKKTNTNFNSSILDLGCGSGTILLSMHREGFKNLTGADPYIRDEISFNGVKIYKKDVFSIDGKYDLVMLHHSFEHMRNPLGVLREIFRILKDSGFVLIRIPLVSSYAWRKYGVNWVQLDAPRHFFLHSMKSMSMLSRKAGFQIFDMEFDSTEFQFWGSEQYLKDIPLFSEKSYLVNKENSIFSQDQMAHFKKKAEILNKEGDGDSACFYLVKQ